MEANQQSGCLFMGRYEHALDPKKRVTIPSEWRNELLPDTQISVLPGVWRPCLLLFPSREMRVRVQQLSASRPVNSAVARDAASRLGEYTGLLPWDGQGRIRIPDTLLKLAGMSDEIIMIGAFDTIELWSPENLAADRARADGLTMGESSKQMGFS